MGTILTSALELCSLRQLHSLSELHFWVPRLSLPHHCIHSSYAWRVVRYQGPHRCARDGSVEGSKWSVSVIIITTITVVATHPHNVTSSRHL